MVLQPLITYEVIAEYQVSQNGCESWKLVVYEREKEMEVKLYTIEMFSMLVTAKGWDCSGENV